MSLIFYQQMYYQPHHFHCPVFLILLSMLPTSAAVGFFDVVY